MNEKLEFLKVTLEERIATVVLDRAARMNALSTSLRDEIERCFALLSSNDEVHAVVLTGGEDIFSAGFDIREIVDKGLDSFTHRILEYHRCIYEFPKPVVTAVGGFALAGGFDLALCGDVIIASETAIFGHPEVRFGINPLLSPLWRKVGLAKAVEIAMTGETINAHEAYRIGLVNKIVPSADLLNEAVAIARKLSKIDRAALLAVKRASAVVHRLDMAAGLEYEFGMSAEILRGPDLRQRVESYARKVGLIA
jgi:enoyl-CoA hydratase/carnithine racemase